MNLSDKIWSAQNKDKWINAIFVKDVKEFIKKLKEECNKFECYDFKENIDKLAGDKLLK